MYFKLDDYAIVQNECKLFVPLGNNELLTLNAHYAHRRSSVCYTHTPT